MELNIQPHTPAALPWEKFPPSDIYLIEGWEVPKTGPGVLKNLKFACPSWKANYGSAVL